MSELLMNHSQFLPVNTECEIQRTVDSSPCGNTENLSARLMFANDARIASIYRSGRNSLRWVPVCPRCATDIHNLMIRQMADERAVYSDDESHIVRGAD